QNTLTGACIKLEHIDNNMDGAHMSGAVTIEVLNDTQASINQNRGYITRINPNTIQILFTRQNNWDDGELFSGLVIDDIMWSGNPERILAKVNVKTKIPYFSKKRITMQTNSILVDFRGLSVKNGDSI